VGIGTLIEPVPVTGLAANFSPMPRMAQPPLPGGREEGLLSGGQARIHDEQIPFRATGDPLWGGKRRVMKTADVPPPNRALYGRLP